MRFFPRKTIPVTKRSEFVLITIVLTIGLLAVQVAPEHYRFWALLGVTVLTPILTVLGLRENIKGVKWVTLIILPTLFTASVGLFYFLLPVRWLTRIPTIVLFAVGIYSILLVENIYNVAVNRTIQLLRVAHAVGFLVTLVTLFLFVNSIYSFRFASYANALLVFVIQFPLMLQSLWSIRLEERISKQILLYTFVFSFIVAQIAYVISFWPLKPIIISLFITTCSYAITGIGQQYFAKRLFQKNIREFIQVVIIVLVLILLTTTYR